MALEQKLSLRLAQRLVMTPSLQQAIKMLQMTRMELETTVNQELVENPVLEIQEERTPESERQPTEEVAQKEGELDHQESMNDIDLEAYFNDYLEGSSYPRSQLGVPEAPPLENTLTSELDLYDHLLFQIHMGEFPADLRRLGELIVGNIDGDGFLQATAEEILRLYLLEGEECSLERVEAALELVRSLDPPGIARPDLRQCLMAQLASIGEADSLAYCMLDEYWDLFLKRQFQTIAKQIGVPLAELEAPVDQIKQLETRPGRQFAPSSTQYVQPDVYVIKVDDEYVVQVNDDGLPKLRVSRSYRTMMARLRAEGKGGEAHQYLTDKMRSALWLIKSLDQRQRTIYKVARSIVKQQRAFLDHGIERLRPMVLRDVAEDIEMHESTVSRVVANKYIHTPRGLYPMKFFFHSGIDRDYGEDISSLTVKRKISQLVQDENPKKPLSDNALAKLLNREGIKIARRTVAKYRDELLIPSSNDRKQVF